MKKILVLGLLMWSCFSAVSQEKLALESKDDSNHNCSFNFYLENDLFADTDRYYTNGIRCSFLFEDLEAGGAPDFAKALDEYIPFLQKGYTHNIGLAIGQDMYTPEDYAVTHLLPNDRPYAGWLYGSLSLHRKTMTTMHKLEFTLGVVGPAARGEEAQNFVHKARNFPTANGWDNQLHNELGMMVHYEYKYRLATDYAHKGWGMDLIPSISVKAGNVITEAGIGATFRFGWNVPQDFHTNRISASAYAMPPKGELYASNNNEFSFYGFFGADGRAVAHNIFLDGNTFRDSHSVTREPWVGDMEAGIGCRWRGIRFTYSQVLITKEFKKQNGDQRFGTISVSFFF